MQLIEHVVLFENISDLNNFSVAVNQIFEIKLLSTQEFNLIRQMTTNDLYFQCGLSYEQLQLETVQNLILTYNGVIKTCVVVQYD